MLSLMRLLLKPTWPPRKTRYNKAVCQAAEHTWGGLSNG